MATQVQQRRGTTAQHNVFTGANGELTVDTSKDTLVIHDGTTQGGFPLARESDIPTGALASLNSVGASQIDADAVGSSEIASSAVTEAKVADNAITLAKMAHGTDGEIITYDSSGAPATVGVGSSGQVLTSNGAGNAPTMQDAGSFGAWTIIESGGTLYFKYSGTNKMKIDSSGNITCVGNVTAYGSV